MRQGVSCAMIRGGTSKGLYFLASDLPSEREERDDLLLRLLGSPDERQIDGLGGGHPLTSKVAVVRPLPEGRVGYRFLQVSVAEASVSDAQNCGNLLAGVGHFAISRGLVTADAEETTVWVELENTGGLCLARIQTPNGRVTYDGETSISGVPGTSAPVFLEFLGVAGSSCGSLFPTGNPSDLVAGVRVTLVDNGMPVVVVSGADLGVSGAESPQVLEENASLRQRLESIRLEAGPLMNLGAVGDLTVPKITLLSPPMAGGDLNTRTFIPHRCHTSIGVLGAASVAAAAGTSGTVAEQFLPEPARETYRIEHPSGFFDLRYSPTVPSGNRTEVVRTARLLMDGIAYPRG